MSDEMSQMMLLLRAELSATQKLGARNSIHLLHILLTTAYPHSYTCTMQHNTSSSTLHPMSHNIKFNILVLSNIEISKFIM